MQVSQLNELDSHTVIGGSKAQAFFMSDSPEFFSLLSSALYREKKLAVVRETICNAHDAHIMIDRPDLEIQIKLTNEELIIKDFGPGIHDDDMLHTYCGYGVSTKVKDNKATGGFGLGCKAPFAYSDHFTVVSCHKGVKSVYAISRGGADTDGKPSLIKMVSSPTTETGITVTVPVHNSADSAEFYRLISRVCVRGGMPAIVNGVKLNTWDYSAIGEEGYGLTNEQIGESPVWVRYGTVLYPLITEDEELNQMVELFKTYNKVLALILQAPAGSIGVKPDREGLSNTPETTATLKRILKAAVNDIKGRASAAFKDMVDEYVGQIKGLAIQPKMDTTKFETARLFSGFTSDPVVISKTIVRAGVIANDFQLRAFRPDEQQVISAMFKALGKKHPNHRRFFRRLANNTVRERMSRFKIGKKYAPDTMRGVFRLATRLDLLKNMLRYGEKVSRNKWGNKTETTDIYPFKAVRGTSVDSPIIVLCRGKEQANGYLHGLGWETRLRYVFIVVRHMKPAQIDEIYKTAKELKIEIDQLDIEAPAPKPKVVKEKKPIGKFVSIDSIYGAQSSSPKVQYPSDNETKTEATVFIDMMTTRIGLEMFKHEVRPLMKARDEIRAVYPDCVLAFGAHQKKALLAAGAKELKDAMSDDFLSLKDKTDETTMLAFWCGFDRYKTTGIEGAFAQCDMRYAKALLGQRPIIGPYEARVHALAALWGKLPYEASPEAGQAMQGLNEASKKAVKGISAPWLQPLVDILGTYTMPRLTKFDPELLAVLQFLQKRAAKAASETTPAAKEAA